MSQSFEPATAFIQDHFNPAESLELQVMLWTITRATGGINYEVGKTEERDPYLAIQTQSDAMDLITIYRETDCGENPRYVLFTPLSDQPMVSTRLSKIVDHALRAAAFMLEDEDDEPDQEAEESLLVSGCHSGWDPLPNVHQENHRAGSAEGGSGMVA